MIKEKWLNYAIAVLKACDNGAGSIAYIADETGGSQSYVAKVIASLRRANIIDRNYELAKPAAQITVRDIAGISGWMDTNSETLHKISEITLAALEVPITQLW